MICLINPKKRSNRTSKRSIMTMIFQEEREVAGALEEVAVVVTTIIEEEEVINTINLIMHDLISTTFLRV
jgi:hypothetical protein